MLTDIAQTSIAVLSLGLRQHGRLLAGRGAEIEKIMKKHDWTCHCCGIRVPQFMEIDHGVGGHTAKCKDLKPICTLCHNIKHPLWAASRGRIIPIHAPDLTQEDVNRLAWMVIGYRTDDTLNVEHIYDAVEARAATFEKMMGVSAAEPFLEAVMAFRSLMSDKVQKAKTQVHHDSLKLLGEAVRFWPADAIRGRDKLPDAALISTWTLGGFKRAGRSAGKALREDIKPDRKKLGDAAAKAMEKS
ncbi:MAG: HNH endonuclease signature motif containing protein [Roseibium sp.]|uniref:HNH endonuclease signature motif containing protein n=1 Tax=Roseibium sp. TaxID=1936156 RepID=UPI00329977C5